VRREEVEKFVEKARGFEDLATYNFKRSRYDLAIFCAEQAAQIYIKAKLLELIGEFPRTHDLIKLLEELSVVYEPEKVKKFLEDNFSVITKLIDAYITSRYYIREFYEREVEEVLNFLLQLRRLLGYD